MANKERTCMICGRHYKFCHHCKEYEREPRWKYLYHDEKCKQIGDLWYAYRGNEITKEEARKALSKLTPNIDAALRYTGTVASNEIREIFDVETDVETDSEIDVKEVVENTQEVDNEPNVVDALKVVEEQTDNVTVPQVTKKRNTKKSQKTE